MGNNSGTWQLLCCNKENKRGGNGMAFTAAQAQRLKSQLGEFNGSAGLGSSAEALAYVNFMAWIN